MRKNVELVQAFYATLGRGDLQAVVELVAEEVDWQSPVSRAHPPEISWSARRHGKKEVAEFFRELGEKVKPEGFEMSTISAQDDRVIVEGRNRGTVNETGLAYEHDWVMVFTIRDERIARLRHYYDTADLIGALQGDRSVQ